MQKSLKQLLVLSGVLLLTAGCATENTASSTTTYAAGAAGGNKSAILASNEDRNSLGNYSLQIIKTGSCGNQYVRVTSLQLDDMPVMVAVSHTNLNNPTFIDILQHSGTKSLGDRVFAPESLIKRDGGYKFSHTAVGNIKNKAAQNYLIGLGYNKDKSMLTRQSKFTYKNETMTVTEYIPHSEHYTGAFFIN